MDKLYIIFTKGNDSNNDFILINYRKCLIYNSYVCGYPIEKSSKNKKIFIEKNNFFFINIV